MENKVGFRYDDHSVPDGNLFCESLTRREKTMPETKQCEVCDQEIGSTEKKCPKCSTDFDELEEAVGIVTKANAVVKKRADKEAAKNVLPPAPPAPPKKKSIFGNLARKG